MKMLHLGLLFMLSSVLVFPAFAADPPMDSNKAGVGKSKKTSASTLSGTYQGADWYAIKLPYTGGYVKDTVDGLEHPDESVENYLDRKGTFHYIAVINGGFHDDSGHNACSIGMNTYWSGDLQPDNAGMWCYGINSGGTQFDIKVMNTKNNNNNYGPDDWGTGWQTNHKYGITGIGALYVNGTQKSLQVGGPHWYSGPASENYKNLRSLVARSTNNDFYLIVCDSPGWTWNDTCNFLTVATGLKAKDASFTVKDAVMHDGSTCAQLGYRIGSSATVMLQANSRGVMSKFRGHN